MGSAIRSGGKSSRFHGKKNSITHLGIQPLQYGQVPIPTSVKREKQLFKKNIPENTLQGEISVLEEYNNFKKQKDKVPSHIINSGRGTKTHSLASSIDEQKRKAQEYL